MAAIRPLTGLRQAEFLKNEVPGVHMPERVVDRMRRAAARGTDHAAAEGVAIARETAAALTGEVAGFDIVAFGERGGAAALGLVAELAAQSRSVGPRTSST